MPSDSYAVLDEYEDYADEIKHFINELFKNYHYLEDYNTSLIRHFSEQKKEHEEYLAKYVHPYATSNIYGNVFPLTLNYSFVILVFLALENQLRVLMNIDFDNYHKIGNLHDYIKKDRGGNFIKYLKYFSERFGCSYTTLMFWSQVDKMNKIRDCIVHTSGYLSDSRDKTEIQRMVKSRDYFAKEDRIKQSKIHYPNENYWTLGELDIDPYEEKLIIGRSYCKMICHYSKNFILDILRNSGMALYIAPE